MRVTPRCRRIALACALALGCASGTAAQGSGHARAQELLARDELRAALAALEDERDPALRADGRAEVYYRASDPAAALEAAEVGLTAAPDHLNLRFRAAASALWLGAGERALEHARALEAALGRAELDPSAEEAWRASAAEFVQAAEDLVTRERARATAVTRARWIAGVGLSGLLAALAWALLAPLRRPHARA